MVTETLTNPLESAALGEANLRFLAVAISPQQNERGAHMDYLGIAGFVFAATAVSVLVYEHQADVLHGPYIEGRAAPQWVEPQWATDILEPLRELVEPIIEQINWRARSAVYLASLA